MSTTTERSAATVLRAPGRARQQGRSSAHSLLTRAGALLIAAALVILAIGLTRHG